jgi:general secretion pathway protein C
MAMSLPLNRIFQVYEHYGRWLPPLASALLVLAIGSVAAQLVWTLVPAPEAAAWRPAPVAASTPAPGAGGGANVETIVAAHLFGQYQAPAAANLARAPDTNLNLTLLGILAAGTAEESFALIGSQPGEEKPYSIGDDVIRGVTLQAIFPDRVILSRNGQMETLRLDKNQPSTGAGPGYVPPVETYEDEPEEHASEEVSSIADIREQVLQDPSRASEFIRVQPANAGGALRGYRVYPGRDRTLFAEVGLRPGDLVTAVNGIQLDDTQKALQMLNDLSRAGNVTLTVERGGQVQTVNVTLD